MRILIDGTPLLLPGGGVKSYVYYWLLHLQRMARDNDRIAVFPFLDNLGSLHHERSNYGGLATSIRLGIVRAANRWGDSLSSVFGHRVDVFHESNTHVLNPPRNCKLTATIHDMTCWLTPHLHAPENIAETRRFGERVLARATRLIAISHNTRRDAAEVLRIPAEQIEVIYPGIADEFFQVSRGQAASVAMKYGLSKPYILSAGVLEPRKNIDSTIEAYLQLPSSLLRNFELIIIGRPGWNVQELEHKLRRGLPGVRYLAYLPEVDVPGVTAGATVFIYPSLYEGFGLPVAQAMAAGVPVITSNTSCLPEITGAAAILVNPKSTAEIGASLERLLLSPSLQRSCSERGTVKASAYRWDICAAKSLDFFRSVAVL